MEKRQWPNVAKGAAVVLRMMLFIDRGEGGGLRHQDEAQQQQYECPVPFAAAKCHVVYSIPRKGTNGGPHPYFSVT